MKIKRNKQLRNTLKFFCRTFGFRKPYQIIVDGSFVQAALEIKNDLRETLPQLLEGSTRIFTTDCIKTELRILGEEYTGALVNARRMENRGCHHKPPVSGSQCIRDIIGDDNRCRYFVASQDTSLRKTLANTGVVPIFLISHEVILIEPVSEVNRLKAREIEQNKLLPKPFEISIFERERQQPATRKRHRTGNPNPLSVKRKKKSSVQEKKSKGGPSRPSGENPARKRARKRKRGRPSMQASGTIATDGQATGTSRETASLQ